MKTIPTLLKSIFIGSFLLVNSSNPVFAEGSWQMGLKQGSTHEQYLFQWDSQDHSEATGLEIKDRPLYVDIENANEIINIHVCGERDHDDLSIDIYNESGTHRLASKRLRSGNVGCRHKFDGILTGGFEFKPGAVGTYQIRLDNREGTTKNLHRFDVFVKADAGSHVDPRQDQGRLWAYRLAFNGNSYAESHSTSANLYAVVGGGFASSFYVWELNLDRLVGYRYELTANSLGLTSPNPDGTIVAALSGCIDTDHRAPCPNPHGNRNTVAAVDKLYLSKPAKPYPRPTQVATATNVKFLDDQGIDDAISPAPHTIGIQDTGDFYFTTNLATAGTYTITIDIDKNGVIDGRDIFLSGTAVPGDQKVNWNGKDNSGQPILPGNYKAQFHLKTGEFHFTAGDAETSGGLTINEVLNDGTVVTSNKVYWNDQTYLGLKHTDSYNADGAHKFHRWGNFTAISDGDKAYIDTYTFAEVTVPIHVHIAIEPVDIPRTQIVGDVFKDTNSNGVRDPGEPGFGNVRIKLTEANGNIFFVTTDSNGFYRAYTYSNATSITVDVDQTTLPPGYVQTAGIDPETVSLTPGHENNVGSDGYNSIPPSITIEKTVDKRNNLAVGETVTYTYVVTNTGRVDINDVTITDVHDGTGVAPVPGNELLTNTSGNSSNSILNDGNIDTLAPGDVATFTSTYLVTQADSTANKAIANAATANGTPTSGTLAPPTDSETITPAPPIPALRIVKTASKTSHVLAGERITYSYVVTNTGFVDIDAVSVTDVHRGTGISPVAGNELLTNTSGNSRDDVANNGVIDTLASGDVVTFTGTYVVTQADIDAATPISNVATAHGTPAIGVLLEPTDSETITPAAPVPALSIVKSANRKSNLAAGDSVIYTYVVTNTGNVDIDTVTVTDVHSGTGTAPTAGNEVLTNTSNHSINTVPNNGIIDMLSPGDVVTFTGSYVVTQADIDAATAIINTATAHGTPKTGTLTQPTDTATVTPSTGAPAMSISKTADVTSNLIAGQTVTYTYVVTNVGNVDIDTVTVTDVHNGTGPAPTAGNEVLTNTSGHSINTVADNGIIDTLAPGDIATFTGAYVVAQADIDAAHAITNTATAHGTPRTGVLTEPTDTATITTATPIPALSITKSADIKSNVVVGQTITYTYVVTNTGNVDVDDVSVADVHNGTGPAPTARNEVLTNTSGLSSDVTPNDGNLNTLAPGDKATFTGTYVVTQADIEASTAITNTATANGTPRTGTLVPAVAQETVIPVPASPGMSIRKTANKTSNAAAGDSITYTYVVTNTGNVNIENVTVADVHLGSGPAPTAGNEVLTNTSGHSSNVTPNDGNIDSLAPGDVATFTGNYVVTQADIDAAVAITNIATANGTPKTGSFTPPTDHEAVIPVPGVAAMSIGKTADKTSNIAVGETVTYTYVVTNTGNVDIDNVTVADVHSGTGPAPTAGNEALTNTSGLSSDLTANDGKIDTLAPGDVATFTGTYVVTQDDIDAATPITNTATGNGTPRTGTLTPPVARETVNPAPGRPAMSISKTADKTSNAAVGDTITYTYVVTNTGNVDIDNVTVADVHKGTGPAPTTGHEVLTNTSGLSIDTIANDGSIDTLAPGDVVTFTGTYVITQADIDAATVIINTATANGTPRAGTLVPPTNQATVTPEGSVPALSIDKAASKTSNAVAGDNITYTYVVTNIGNVDIDDVNVTDVHSGTGVAPTTGNELLTNTSGHSSNIIVNDGNIDMLAPGDVATFTGIYVVTQADIDAGLAITNTATALGTPKSGTLVPPTDAETVNPVDPVPSMNIVKTADKKKSAVAGDTITYTYVVTNNGNINIRNVNVTDVHNGNGPAPVAGNEMLQNTSGSSVDTTPNDGHVDILAPGDVVTFTGIYVVTQADIDAGTAIINTATAHGTPNIGVLTEPIDQETVIPVPGVPALSIEKTANKTTNVSAGDLIYYTYVVTNTGNVDIDTVTVTDVHSGTGAPPATANESLINTSGLSIDLVPYDGIIDTLAPHDAVTFSGTYQVTQADIDAGAAIENTATAHGIPKTGSLTEPTDNERITTVAPAPAMTIIKTADATNNLAAGQTVTYTYVVTNTGNVDIDDVSVADVHNGKGPAPTAGNEVLTNTSGLSSDTTPNDGNIDTLAPGDVVTFTGTYVVTQDDVDAGVAIINTATANGTPRTGTLVPPANQETVIPVPGIPALTLEKTASKKNNVIAGETITYIYVVTNAGNVDIDDVSVADVHNGKGPAPTAGNEVLTNTSGLSSDTTPNDGNIDTLAPGDVVTFSGTYMMLQADIDAGVAIINTATANGTPRTGTLIPPTKQETVIPVPGIPALTIEKAADKKSNVVAGDTIIYTYVVTNAGNVDIDTVTVADVHSGTGSPAPTAGNEVLTNTSGLSNDAIANDGVIDTLAPGDIATFTGTYQVTQADIDAGIVIENKATAEGTPRAGKLVPPIDQEIVTPAASVPAMAVEKTADKRSNIVVGKTITYTYVVTNTGNIDIDDVSVADVHSGTGPAPTAGNEVLTNTSGLSSDLTANDGNIDTLAPGDVVTFTGTYVVTQADVDAGVAIINTATANGTPRTGVLVPPINQETIIPVPGVPVLSIEKTADKTSNVAAGDMITYTYVVTNTGNVDVDDVSVADVHGGSGPAPTAGNEVLTNTSGLSSDVTANDGNIDTLAPGDIATFTGTYKVTQDDIDAGMAIENNANAKGTPKTGVLVPLTDKEIITPVPGVPALSIEKTADKTSDAEAGDTITYTYVVTNTGNVGVDDVTVADAHSGTGTAPTAGNEVLTNTSGLSIDATANDGSIDTLAPGDSVTFTGTYVVTQEDINTARVIVNTAIANAIPKIKTLTPPTVQETVIPAGSAPSMSIEKTADKTSNVVAGDTVIYTYVVTNIGNVEIDDVSVADVHSGTGVAPTARNEVLTNTSGLSVDTTPNDGIINTLAPGDVATFTGDYVVTAADVKSGVDITNTATANGTPKSGVLTPPTAQERVIPSHPAIPVPTMSNINLMAMIMLIWMLGVYYLTRLSRVNAREKN